MAIPVYGFGLTLRYPKGHSQQGQIYSGCSSVEIHKDSAVVTLSELGTSGYYYSDTVTAGRYILYVNAINTTMEFAVGAGELAGLGYSANKYLGSTDDSIVWADPPTLTAANVGLGNVTNVTQIPLSYLGAANGVATLNGSGLIPATQLPSYVDDVLEFANLAALPAVGETGKIYVTLDTNLTYRWTGTVYTEISKSLALGTTSSTAYQGDLGAIAYAHSQLSAANPHGTTFAQIASKPTTVAGFGITDITSQLLTGYAVGSNAAIVASDSILGAFNKVQAQLNGKQTSGAYLTANQGITVSGDVLGAGSTAITTTLANIVTAATVGGASVIPSITYDSKGRITSTTGNAISCPASAITGNLPATQISGTVANATYATNAGTANQASMATNVAWATTSPGSYGQINITAAQNGGYDGFKFGNTNLWLMIHPTYTGIYTGSAWIWRFNNGVLDVGTVPAANISGTVANATHATSADWIPTATVLAQLCSGSTSSMSGTTLSFTTGNYSTPQTLVTCNSKPSSSGNYLVTITMFIRATIAGVVNMMFYDGAGTQLLPATFTPMLNTTSDTKTWAGIVTWGNVGSYPLLSTYFTSAPSGTTTIYSSNIYVSWVRVG